MELNIQNYVTNYQTYYEGDSKTYDFYKSLNFGNRQYRHSGTDFDKWVESLINQLRTNVDETERDKMAKPVLNDYDWVNISKLFLE